MAGRTAGGIQLGRILALCAAMVAAGAVASQSSPPPAPPPPEPPSEFSEAPAPPPPPSRPAATLETVYFDFDRSNIRPDMESTLRANANAIKSERGWGTITLEGHCDERGSEEYNLALGDRRAMSVKRYFVDLGVPSTSLETVSFGEAKPAVMGHDESAWRYNRRVDFAVGN